MWVNHTEIRCEEHYTYTLLRKVAEGLAILTGTLAAGVVGAVVVRGYTIEA